MGWVKESFRFIDENGKEKIEALVPSFEIQVRRDKPSAQDMIVPLVRNLVHKNNEKVSVFRNQRGTAEGCAHYLADELKIQAMSNNLESSLLGKPTAFFWTVQ